jgi:hypothetical protein
MNGAADLRSVALSEEPARSGQVRTQFEIVDRHGLSHGAGRRHALMRLRFTG